MSASGILPVRRSRRTIVLLGAALAVALTLSLVLVAILGGKPGPRLGVDGVSAGPHPLSRAHCRVSRTLVPSCGHWWGVAPMAHTTTPLLQGMHDEEQIAGRTLDIVHTYHVDGELFPDSAERRLALQPGHHRLLLINWKPATDMSWRRVAQGGANARIDREAAYLKTHFRHRFFLDIWHEPENDVIADPSRGMTAVDYRAMYQHVVRRLRADGVSWAVTVMNYMGFDNWAHQPWFRKLWPGRKYVDWLAIDPYGSGARSGWTARNFTTLVNRPDGSFPGFYTWARTVHPLKPIMLAEWGVQAVASNPGGQAHFFRTVDQQLRRYPKIKALVYFDMPKPPPGQPRTYLKAAPQTASAYRALVRARSLIGPAVPH
jgi:hypothetical protein